MSSQALEPGIRTFCLSTVKLKTFTLASLGKPLVWALAQILSSWWRHKTTLTLLQLHPLGLSRLESPFSSLWTDLHSIKAVLRADQAPQAATTFTTGAQTKSWIHRRNTSKWHDRKTTGAPGHLLKMNHQVMCPQSERISNLIPKLEQSTRRWTQLPPKSLLFWVRRLKLILRIKTRLRFLRRGRHTRSSQSRLRANNSTLLIWIMQSQRRTKSRSLKERHCRR